MKKCSKCKILKDLESFYKNKNKKSGLQDMCKSCWTSYNKSDLGRNRDKKRNQNPNRKRSLKNKNLIKWYGITIEVYESMLLAQKYLCAICHQPEKEINVKTGLIKDLSVDHNHYTGKVRQLLCSNCNHGIGNFKENLNFLKNAVDYIKFHNS